ncbi:hypothetical protein [Nibricoccus sp. IMCC34717]|uniref:hypothetical protein n=1 Tax=Nibricoccus sp. IMCC34717 TaxID=3034021 RepID=UPI00384AD7B5
MNPEPNLPQTPTHSGLEAKGTILGLEGRSVVPVLGAAVLSVLLVALNLGGDPESLPMRLGVALLPVVLTTAYVVLFVHRKPPHFARDVAEHWRGLFLDRFVGVPTDAAVFNARPLHRRPPDFVRILPGST